MSASSRTAAVWNTPRSGGAAEAVCRNRQHPHSAPTQLLDRLLRLRATSTAASDQRQMARPLRGQPLRQFEPEAAEAARDQIGAVGANLAFRHQLGRRRARLHAVKAPHDGGERLRTGRSAENLPRKRREILGVEPRQHFGQQLPEQFRPISHDVTDIDVGHALIGLERHRGNRLPAALHVHEASERREQRERLGGDLARQHIEHHVDAAALGVLHDPVDKLQGRAIEHVLDAKRAQLSPFLGIGGRHIQCGPEPSRHLDGGESERVRRPVDQHSLAFLQTRDVVDGIIGAHESREQRIVVLANSATAA